MNNKQQKNWKDKVSELFLREPKDLQELINLIRQSAKQDIIESDSLNMIEGVLSVSEKQVRDVMIPRPKIVVIDGNNTAKDALPTITDSGHSRFPIIDKKTEKITGILLAKDLLKIITDKTKENWQMQRIMRPAKVVPESKRLDILLKEFRENRNHMAIVVDEYGRTAGLVTIEDLLEEIVGEIADEFDSEEQTPVIIKKNNTTFTTHALTTMEDFNEYFHTDYAHDDFDTIGGLLLKSFSHVPKKGESINIPPLHFTILSANKRGIKDIKVQTHDEI